MEKIITQKYNNPPAINFNKHHNMLKSALSQITKYEQTKTPTLEIAQAYYNIGKLDESEQVILKLQNDEKLQKLQDDIQKQRLQSAEGLYDFKQMVEEAKQHFFVRCSNFKNPDIEIRQIQTTCGYFAKQQIELGCILMVEKAFLAGENNDRDIQLQLKKQLKDNQVQQYLLSLKQSELSELLVIQSSQKELTYEELTARCGTNVFTALPRLEYELTLSDAHALYPVQVLGSQNINHSCIPNAFWYFIGDVQFIVSQKQIQKDEQISIKLIGIDDWCSYSDLPKQLKERFDYVCQCEMCMSITDQQRNDLSKFKQVSEQKLKQIFANGKATQEQIIAVQDICKRAESIFDDCKANRLGLCWFSAAQLAYAYSQNETIQSKKRALEVQVNSLAYFGIDTEDAQKGKLTMSNRYQHQLNSQVIDIIFNIMTFVKIVDNNTIANWLNFLKQVFYYVTGGCEDYQYFLKLRLERHLNMK
ncbi:SET_domain-containing protein [Hexamita inflata]|uniref:SET domain-containing protein n=1 Tax=Hexamita inflata TaxID=28002 RepID=A0AA86U571_9EUKA|nr:SET domain-containing protein [Hexamita inflata]